MLLDAVDAVTILVVRLLSSFAILFRGPPSQILTFKFNDDLFLPLLITQTGSRVACGVGGSFIPGLSSGSCNSARSFLGGVTGRCRGSLLDPLVPRSLLEVAIIPRTWFHNYKFYLVL